MRDVKVAAFIAYKSILKGNKSALTLIIFILSLSVLNMMFISGILFGLEKLFEQALIDTYSSDITLSPQQKPQAKEFILNQNEVRAQIEAIPGVIATTRRYSLPASMTYDKEKSGLSKSISATIVGVDPDQDKKVFITLSNIMDGETLSYTDRDQIILSSAIAGGKGMPAPADLGGAGVGDKVRIAFANGIQKVYTVKGIYNDTLGIFTNFITAQEAESVLSVYNNASQILVKTDLSRAPLKSYEKKISNLYPNLKMQTYKDLLGAFLSFINALSLISVIVSAISIMVAAVTIFVLIYVNAVNKRRQIGILKAIGIKKEIIIISYVFQSFFYSICGAVIGSIFVFFVLTPLLERYPINVDFGLLSLAHSPVMVIGGTISLIIAGLLAGYIPARMVAREEILKAIWG